MDFVFSLSWIPASAGMTTKDLALATSVTPAKAGVQVRRSLFAGTLRQRFYSSFRILQSAFLVKPPDNDA
jgi:hypothetical protein